MKIRAKISKTMDLSASPLGSTEDRVIRIPVALRKELNIETGSFISLAGVNSDQLLLQVDYAYKKEVLEDDQCAYITTATHNALKIDKVNTIAHASDIMIGCDPEFFITDARTGFHISAGNFFTHQGEIGNDVGLGELRPRPNFTADGLVLELAHLIGRVAIHLNNRRWMQDTPIKLIAASFWNNSAAGFHMHFGLPRNMLGFRNEAVTIQKSIVRVLDYYVGVPSILPEGDTDWRRRARTLAVSYGKPGDYRIKPNTLEYRVPGGHLLRHPILTAGLFSISLVVMKDVLSRMSAYTENFSVNVGELMKYETLKHIYPNLPTDFEVDDIVTSRSISNARKHAKTIFEDLTHMIGYNESSNRHNISEYFTYLTEFLVGKKQIDADMLSNWGIKQHARQSI